MLFTSSIGNAQTTYLLNDSTVCTSTANVLKTANKTATLEAQKAYLISEVKICHAAKIENMRFANDLKATKKTLRRQRIAAPLYALAGAFAVYVIK